MPTFTIIVTVHEAPNTIELSTYMDNGMWYQPIEWRILKTWDDIFLYLKDVDMNHARFIVRF